MSEVVLRDYQQEALKAATIAFEGGMQRAAEVLPTGAGKTVVFSAFIAEQLAERRIRRALVLAHRDELIRQAVGKLRSVAPNLRVGVVKADENGVGAPIVVGSVQTLRHEARRARLRDVGLIVVDECHHATAPSYRAILEHYGAFDGGAKALGFTATMSRGDGVGLGEVWQDVVYERDIGYMITRRFLVKPRGLHIRVEDLDLSKVRKTAGDYSDGQLGDALAKSMAPERIVDAYREHTPNEPALCFVPTVAFGELIVDRFRAAGVRAAIVTGAQPAEERRRVLRDFQAGKLKVLVNCMVLTEGTDLPLASCVIIARPTMHSGLYVQMVGRVLRPFPGKTRATVLDVVGASRRHALAGLTDLLGERGVYEDDAEPLDPAETPELDDQPGNGPDRRERAWLDGVLFSEEIDLFHGQRARWQRTYGGHWFVADAQWFLTVVPALSGSGAWDVIAAHKTNEGVSQWVVREIDDMGYAMAHAESVVQGSGNGLGYAKRQATWRKKPASDAQRHWLRMRSIVLPGDATSGEASDVRNIVEASARLDHRLPAVQ